MIEIMIAVAVFSIAFLAIGKGFVGVTKSLTQSRVKFQAAQFAKSEIDNFIKLSRIGASAGGVREAKGYFEYVAASGRMLRSYPDALMTGAPSPNVERDRYMLYRTVEVSTFAANGSSVGNVFISTRAGEYRLVRVKLEDSISPPRFAPIVLETKILRPDLDALDMRESNDVGALTGMVLDYDTNASVLATPGVTGRVSLVPSGRGDDLKILGPSQNFLVTNIPLALGPTFITSFTAQGYWPEEGTVELRDAGVTVSLADPPNQNPRLRPVVMGVPSYRVVEYGTGNPIPGASITMSHFINGARTPPPAAPEPYDSTFDENTRTTDANGFVSWELPIPFKGPATSRYPDSLGQVPYTGYARSGITAPGYVPMTSTQTFVLQKGALTTETITLYPYKYGTVNVVVKKADGTPIKDAVVGAWDNAEEYTASPKGTRPLIDAPYPKTDINGVATLSNIRLNYFSSNSTTISKTSRNVYITVQRLGYVYWAAVRTISQGSGNVQIDATLTEHYIETYSYVHNPPYKSTPSSRISVTKFSSPPFGYFLYYYGHLPGRLWLNPTAPPSTLTPYGMSYNLPVNWIWTILSQPAGGTNGFPSGGMNGYFSAKTAGLVDAAVDVDLSFTVTNNEFGGQIGDIITMPHQQELFYINVIESASPKVLTLEIDDSNGATAASNDFHASMPAGQYHRFFAKATYSLGSLPSDMKYEWSFTSPAPAVVCVTSNNCFHPSGSRAYPFLGYTPDILDFYMSGTPPLETKLHCKASSVSEGVEAHADLTIHYLFSPLTLTLSPASPINMYAGLASPDYLNGGKIDLVLNWGGGSGNDTITLALEDMMGHSLGLDPAAQGTLSLTSHHSGYASDPKNLTVTYTTGGQDGPIKIHVTLIDNGNPDPITRKKEDYYIINREASGLTGG